MRSLHSIGNGRKLRIFSRQQRRALIHINLVREIRANMALTLLRSSNLAQPVQLRARKALRWLKEQGRVQMTSIVRIAVPASTLFASGWLFRDPTSVPLWQIGLALLLAGVGVFWMYLHES